MGRPRLRSNRLTPTAYRSTVHTISLPRSKPSPANEASRATVDTLTPADSDTLMSAVSRCLTGAGQSFQFRALSPIDRRRRARWDRIHPTRGSAKMTCRDPLPKLFSTPRLSRCRMSGPTSLGPPARA